MCVAKMTSLLRYNPTFCIVQQELFLIRDFVFIAAKHLQLYF